MPVVPGDLDTLRAWAVAAGDVRCAFLLVGIRDGPSTDMKEPITVPNKEKNDADQPQLGHHHRQDHPERQGQPRGKARRRRTALRRRVPLAGLKLIGFSIWERRGGNGRNVTFPARQYAVNGERRSFALLRPIVDTTAQDAVRERILEAYAEYEEAAAAATA